MTPAEIQMAVQAFQVLEPLAQRGVADLIHKLHRKTLTAQDYLDMAAKFVPPAKS
jgi:hypothetical protein